jgi:hypothetical protein
MRNVFLATFLFLIVTIIFTPLIVSRGFPFISEETLEAVLLFAQVTIAWSIFRLYEEAMRRRENEISQLEKEYQEREKELIETFTYLGKVNVQMSLIREFLGKLKAPANRHEVKEYIDEILRMSLAISKREWITLRIIKADERKTVSEYWAKSSPKVETKEIKIGNKDLLEIAGEKKYCHRSGYCVVPSTGAGASNLKTFLVFEENNIDREIQDFLSAAVNQCDIIFSLFEIKHLR